MKASQPLAEGPTIRRVPGSRPLLPSRRALLDLVGQQIVWWSAVALVRRGHPGLAALPALAFVAASAWAGRGGVMKLAGIGVLLGAVLDSVLVWIGALALPSDPGRTITTLWMLGLWAAFGVAFTGSMGWLARRGPLSAGLIGAAAGMLAYRAGASLGVLAIGGAPGSYFAIAASWALALSILAAAARGLPASTDGEGASRPDDSQR